MSVTIVPISFIWGQPSYTTLSTNMTTTGDSAYGIDRGRLASDAAMVVISATAGTTITIALNGSVDNSNWFIVPYADVSAPTTWAVTTFTMTTSTTVFKILNTGVPWEFFKITYSANTGMTITDAHIVVF